jgi:hypothetical protein
MIVLDRTHLKPEYQNIHHDQIRLEHLDENAKQKALEAGNGNVQLRAGSKPAETVYIRIPKP